MSDDLTYAQSVPPNPPFLSGTAPSHAPIIHPTLYGDVPHVHIMPSVFDQHPPINSVAALQPAFVARRTSQLPTPQSPHDLGQYTNFGQASPIYAPPVSYRIEQPKPAQPFFILNEKKLFNFESHQTITPEASPSRPNLSLPHQDTTPVPLMRNPPQASSSSVTLQTSIPSWPNTQSMPSPHSAVSSEPSIPSTLSSPFMAKATPLKSKSPSKTPDFESHDIFSSGFPSSSAQSGSHGGEIDRIRVQMLEEKLIAQREAESRRPDYLKRQKRTHLETDLSHSEFPELDDDMSGLPGVGITESPNKGRRLKLFQETSEESFEESLMAGGYGLYRTSDWQHPSYVIEAAPRSELKSEGSEEPAGPPTEKELRKRKRLQAFMKKSDPAKPKLVAVELEGRGRVLLDTSASEEREISPPPDISPKKRGNRRKRKGVEGIADSPAKGKPPVLPQEQSRVEQPNWPDQEFPWKLRTEERTELLKAEEEDRLRCIERFLDRDTDDEDEENDDQDQRHPGVVWGRSAGLMGRGKIIPLFRNGLRLQQPAFWYHSNPADARAALLSRKSIRALQKRRNRNGDDSEDEAVCICNGQDDGRDLVQCDACKRWYHLECIGIGSIADLGPEEDPWFCECVSPSTPPSGMLLLSEPTFVPTDIAATTEPIASDLPFFHITSQDSPMPSMDGWRPPTTPVRGDYESLTSTRSSWIDSSRHGPRTPHQNSSVQSVRIWQSTPDNEQDDVFDPLSTPSRGIKFQPFVTPKNGNLWSMRNSNSSSTGFLLQTPSKASRLLRHTLAKEEDSVGSIATYDDSPIRRTGRGGDGLPRLPARGLMDSPTMSRNSVSHLSKRRSEPSFPSSLTSDVRHQFA